MASETPAPSRPYDKPIVDIARYVFHYEIDDDPQLWQCARNALLDALGCAIETVSKSEDVRRMLGPTVPGTIIPNGFRLPGTEHVLDPVKGAFDMGTLIRYLDHNDALGGAEWGHPSDNLGAILAVADWVCRTTRSGHFSSSEHRGPPLTVRTILIALIKAYEIQGVYQIKNAFNIYGIDHVILVKLASAAVVSWLLGLTEQQTMDTLSHVWMDGAQPSRVYRSGENTISRKGWAAGDACMRAVQLAMLTRAGQSGSPSVLTAPKWGFFERTFGTSRGFDLPQPFGNWVIQCIFFKVMPAEGHGISSVEAALIQRERAKKQGFAPSQIFHINVRTTEAANLIINKTGPLHNPADRDHCIQYMIALAYLKGDIPAVEDYEDNGMWAKSPELEELRKKVNVYADAQFTADYLDVEKKSAAAGLTVTMTDGTVLDEVVVEYPAGHVTNKRTAALVREKFERNMRLRFDESRVQQVLQAVEEDEMSVMEFLDLFRYSLPVDAKL